MDIFILFSLFLLLVTAAGENCPVSFCGNNRIPVRFPFTLQDKQPENCGYPGFDLACDGSMIVLTLPKSGKFFVRNIDYSAPEITLFDPENCLPKRRLSLDLSGSPFYASYPRNFTFLSCPVQDVVNGFTALDCLSNSTSKFFAVSSTSALKSFPPDCQKIEATSVPIPWLFPYNDDDSSDILDQDILLTWYNPNCRDCEADGGICGFKNNSSQEIGCFLDQKSGKPSTLLRQLIRAIQAEKASSFASFGSVA